MKWLTRIRRALKRGRFTLEDVSLAGEWQTCMMSERPRTRHFENDPTNEPVDERLRSLGLEFYDAVQHDEAQRALELRRRILRK